MSRAGCSVDYGCGSKRRNAPTTSVENKNRCESVGSAEFEYRCKAKKGMLLGTFD